MTTAPVDGPAGRFHSFLHEMRHVGPGRVVAAAAIALVYAVALLNEERLRGIETCLTAALVRAAGQSDAQCFDQTVTFWLDGRFVGYTITVGCTAVMLLFPFFAVAGLLALVRRAPLRHTLLALVCAAALVFSVNQIRMVLIWAGMKSLGFERGFEVTHILIGTAVSTVGLVISALLALKILLAGQPRREQVDR